MVDFIKPTYDLIEIMAKDMRRSDKVEVSASHGHTPLQALTYSIENSEQSALAIHDDVPLAVFGVAVSNRLTGLGHPWLLSSNAIFNHKDYLLEIGPVVIADMIAVCPRLVNFVHHENRTSIKWLKSLGFIIEDPQPYGVKDEPFHKFHMGVI